MRKIDTIDKVSRIDILDNTVLVGKTSKELHGVMAVGGDEICMFRAGEIISSRKLIFLRFHSFLTGILFKASEGSPILFSDFEDTVEVANKNFHIKPLQNRVHTNISLLIETDEIFNQIFYILNGSLDKKILPQFPKILLEDSFIYFDKSKVEKFSLSNFELEWEIEIDPEDQVERRNQGGAVFSDGENVYVRLKGGRLTCLTLSEGKKLWELTNEIDQVSFSEYGDFVYVHKGDGLIEVEKSSGRIVRNLNYRDVKDLDDFSSNGIVWCFEKILVVRNSFTGDLAVFNRGTFELIHREVVDEAGIPESRDCIKFLNNYLYVLSTSSRLHTYEIGLIGQTA